MNNVKIETAIISVHDKSGIKYFVSELLKLNPKIKIISSGGTYNELSQVCKENLVQVSEVTGFPEMPSGLVKTLHPRIHGGILGNDPESAFMREHSIGRVDLVVVNLYPFRQAKKEGFEKARTNIDIGGVSLIEAASKNFLRVAVVSDPVDYEKFLETLRNNNCETDLAARLSLAKRGFRNIAFYISDISKYFDEIGMEDLDVK
jgi:phosphoribosylaminoimidazolecarboxamide formyltransferase / IMP cyclohydrolase